MAKVRFVQLEPEAIVAEPDFQVMTAEERGVYLSMILYLYCNNGRLKLNVELLRKLCNARPDFDFAAVLKKFINKKGMVYHRSVSQSMAKARRLMQARREAGLMGAEKKWQSHNKDNSIATVSKGNVIASKDKQNSYSSTNTGNPSFTPSNSIRGASLNFHDALTQIIGPKDQSDRTCFHNVTAWLAEQIARGRFDEHIYARVLDIAGETCRCRKPAAAFMARLKKDLGYNPAALSQSAGDIVADLARRIGTQAKGNCAGNKILV